MAGSTWWVVIVVLGVVTLPAAVLVRRARRRRSRDLRVLEAVGAALGGARRSEPLWAGIVPALRTHLGARRVVVVVDGHTVLDGAELPGGVPDDLPRSRRAVVWTRRSVPMAARSVFAARGVDELVVVPLRSGEAQLGVLEVHDPVRPRWARGDGLLLSPRRAHLRGELALLTTVGRQLAAVVDTARLEDRLRHDARHDPVTGLLNRAGFLELAGRIPGGGVVMIDLGLLGQVNDALGHVHGERFVALAGRRLSEACDALRCGLMPTADVPDPVVARLEGDTFAVAVGERDPRLARRVAEELRERLVAPYVVEGLPFEAPVVVGVALDPGPGEPEPPHGSVEPTDADGAEPRPAALLRRADVALADARRGTEPVRCYAPSMGERAERRLALIRGFQAAVAHRQLRVDYQPTVSLHARGDAGGTVLGVEALARWSHPELGELLPDEFIPVLEATGQIDELTRFVLDESLAAARGWLDVGLRLSVAVNVAVDNLGDERFPDEVAARLARHRVPAELLTLELTESGVSAEREAALPVLRRLHALGCHLAVDDFGTGQSSLAHLRRLPVDQVKIDKSFVLGMDTERGDVAVVRAIVEMGHTLGLTVVAEGVEQPAVRSALVEMGCDVAQGYLVSRPLAARSLERWLSTLAVLPVAPGGEGGPLTLIA